MALTRKEIDKRYYERCKEKGVCSVCGKKLDRKGVYCIACRKKDNERKREDREYYRQNHICTVCGKERVYGEDKICFECRTKNVERIEGRTEDQKVKYRNRCVDANRKRRERLRKSGFCTECGKRKVEEGKKKCRLCLDKDAERQRLKRIDVQKIREYRKTNHLCYFCGGPVETENKQVCSKCSEKMQKYSNKAKRNQYFREENRLIFVKK